MELIAGRFDTADSITWLHFISCITSKRDAPISITVCDFILKSTLCFSADLSFSLNPNAIIVDIHSTMSLRIESFRIGNTKDTVRVFFFTLQIERFKRQCHLNESVLVYKIPWRRRRRQPKRRRKR